MYIYKSIMVGWYVVPFGAMLLGLAPWLVVSLLCRVLMRDICEVLGWCILMFRICALRRRLQMCQVQLQLSSTFMNLSSACDEGSTRRVGISVHGHIWHKLF